MLLIYSKHLLLILLSWPLFTLKKRGLSFHEKLLRLSFLEYILVCSFYKILLKFSLHYAFLALINPFYQDSFLLIIIHDSSIDLIFSKDFA